MIMVSVVVPIYNIKDYLERCVNSIIKQTIKDIEIILVDDGSTDGSAELCDQLKMCDSRVKVIHQTNQGLGPARNTGLNIATGQYVSFVDSDDWLEENAYEIMINAMKTHNARISTCGRKIVDDNTCLGLIYCSDKEKVLYENEIIENYLIQSNMNMSACDKLFDRKLFEGICFPAGYVSEDIVPIYNVIKKVDKIVLTGKPFYNYYCRTGSLSRNIKFSKKRMGQILYSTQVAEDVKKNYPNLDEQADYYVYDALISTWRNILRANYKGKEKRQIRDRIKGVYLKMLSNKYMHLKQKLYVVLMMLRIDWIAEKFI